MLRGSYLPQTNTWKPRLRTMEGTRPRSLFTSSPYFLHGMRNPGERPMSGPVEKKEGSCKSRRRRFVLLAFTSNPRWVVRGKVRCISLHTTHAPRHSHGIAPQHKDRRQAPPFCFQQSGWLQQVIRAIIGISVSRPVLLAIWSLGFSPMAAVWSHSSCINCISISGAPPNLGIHPACPSPFEARHTGGNREETLRKSDSTPAFPTPKGKSLRRMQQQASKQETASREEQSRASSSRNSDADASHR
ncbi:hypothetical protein B0T17DRAFT_505504 [Bombardia bombarda]|uniref:Uncharacterized protein n=1 Tax=Bombardia bombarda TaxID=252184 RepID=A0AA39X7S1_9PEZI|nr:hypothetical protein B0T17DRAFT_505504 [Bombardia bombarda]